MEAGFEHNHPVRKDHQSSAPQVLTNYFEPQVINDAFRVRGSVINPGPTELLTLPRVEQSTGMKRSNIYRKIQLGLFPPPVHVGGARWIGAEVDEYVQRCKDERDRQRGENKFAPRPAILNAQGAAQNGSFSGSKPGSPAVAPPSTIRILGPEIVQALRLLKIDIPELSLDPAAWNVSLAVVKVELASASPEKKELRRKKR